MKCLEVLYQALKMFTGDEEEKARLKADLKNLDKNLGPYPYESWKQWVSLSNRINSKY